MFKFGQGGDQSINRFVKKTLPKNYAESLLNLEIEIELNENVQIDVFQELISLYMSGVEYYESIKDRKYIYFQRRLNGLMVKPSFINATQKTCEKPSESETEAHQKKNKFDEEQRKLELELIYSQTDSKEVQVKEIVENHSQQQKQIESIINQGIAQQSDSFNKRLELRKRSKLTHSYSQPSMNLEQMVAKAQSEQIKEVEKQLSAVYSSQQTDEIKNGGIKEEEQEEEAQGSRKGSLSVLQIQERKWQIIQGIQQQEQKQRTNSTCYKRSSLLLNTMQLQKLIKKRRNSEPIITSSEEIVQVVNIDRQLQKDKERIQQLYDNKFKKQ